MSGVYIKGLEMPKKGLVEIIISPNGICYELARPLIDTERAKVTEYYDAIAVPDHGDLIDRDVVADALDVMAVYGRLRDAFDMVMSCEAVIPAERSEDAQKAD